jgi:hypothetical protein
MAEPRILIKGKRVVLITTDERVIARPESHGIIHDPTGQLLPRCDVFIGPYRRYDEPVELDGHGRQYFGRRYQGTDADVLMPGGPWRDIAQARVILYLRDRGHYASHKPYRHPFRHPVDVAQCGSMLRLRLPDGCIVSWRGFVKP